MKKHTSPSLQQTKYKRISASLLIVAAFILLTSACTKTSTLTHKPQIKIQGKTEISIGHSKKL